MTLIKCCICGKEVSPHNHGKKQRYCKPCYQKIAYQKAKNKFKRGLAEGTLYGKPIIHVFFDRYRAGAKKRNVPFEIDIEYFSSFWHKPCTYCGAEIETIGVDRMDNEDGYVIGNLCSCCRECNLMKRALAAEDFIAHCARVARQNRMIRF